MILYSRVQSVLSTIMYRFLYCIAPPVCAYCSCFLQKYTVLCSSCMQYIVPLVSVMLPITKTYNVSVLSVGEYSGPLKKLVLAKGYSDVIASYELGQLVADYIMRTGIRFDYVVPVPLHWTRYAHRGYNQAENIASVVAQRMKVPKVMLVRRIRATPQQSTVAADQREKNVTSAFCLARGDFSMYRNKRILIVDDVMTTGATMKAAIKAIKSVSPHSIVSIVAARVK